MNTKSKTQAGFTVISSLITIIILTITMTAFAAMLTNTEKAMSATKRKNDFEELKIAVRNVLQSPSLCPSAMRAADGSSKLTLDLSSAGFKIPTFSSGGTSPLIDLASNPTHVRASGLEVTNLEISSAVDDGDYTIGDAQLKRYDITIELKAKQPTGSYGTAMFKSEYVALPFYLDSNNQVVACGLDVQAHKALKEKGDHNDDGHLDNGKTTNTNG